MFWYLPDFEDDDEDEDDLTLWKKRTTSILATCLPDVLFSHLPLVIARQDVGHPDLLDLCRR